MAARRGADDRALPARRRAGAEEAAQGAARARRRPSSRTRRGCADGGRPRRRSAARSATSPSPRRSRPSLPTFGVQGFVLDARGARRPRRPAGRDAAGRAREGARASSPRAPTSSSRARRRSRRCMRRRRLRAASRSPRPGLREGVFFERHLAPSGLFADVRGASVRNLALQYSADELPHVEHVAELALEMFDDLAAAGVHPRRPRRARAAVGGRDAARHRRRRRLRRPPQALAVPRSSTPGCRATRSARSRSIAQIGALPPQGLAGARRDRAAGAQGRPPAGRRRGATLLRLAEQLERSRDQLVRAAHVEVDNGTVELRLEGEGDVSLARWAAQRQGELFERAFEKRLSVDVQLVRGSSTGVVATASTTSAPRPPRPPRPRAGRRRARGSCRSRRCRRGS